MTVRDYVPLARSSGDRKPCTLSSSITLRAWRSLDTVGVCRRSPRVAVALCLFASGFLWNAQGGESSGKELRTAQFEKAQPAVMASDDGDVIYTSSTSGDLVSQSARALTENSGSLSKINASRWYREMRKRGTEAERASTRLRFSKPVGVSRSARADDAPLNVATAEHKGHVSQSTSPLSFDQAPSETAVTQFLPTRGAALLERLTRRKRGARLRETSFDKTQMGAGAAFARRLSSVSGSPTGIVPFAPLPPADSPELETFENAENSFPQQEAPAGTSSRAAEQPEPRQGVSATTLLARRTLEEMSSVGKGIGLYLHGIIFRGQIIWQKSVLDKIKANLDVLNFVERFQPQFAPSRRELLEELDMWQDTMQRVTQEQQALLLSRQQPPDLLSSPSQTADASGSAVPQSPGSQQIQPETMRGESPSYQQLPQDMPFRFGEPGGFVALSDEEKPGQPTAAAPHQDPAALVEREEHSMMTTGGLRPASAPAVAQSNTAEVGQNGLTATQEIDLPLLHRAQSLPFPEVAHHDGGVPAALTISEEGLKDASRCYSFIPDMEAHPQELEVSPESIADAPGDAHGKKIVASFSERHNENNVVGSEGSTTLLRGHSLDEATPRRAIEEPEVIHARRWDSPEKRIFLSCVETHTDARAPSFHDGAPAAPVAGVTLGKQQTQAGGGNEPHLAQDVDGTRVPLGQDDGSRVVPSPLGRAASGGTPDGLADTPRGHETASMHATAPHDLAPRFYGAPDTGYASSVAAAKTYPDGGPSFYGQRILMPTRVAAEVRSLDLYLSMFQGTFQKCGSLLSRALLEDDSRELTWFFHHVLPVLIFINRIWVLVLTSQHRRGVRTPASTERQLQKVRSIVFDIRIVDEAFLHAIQSKDDGAVAENRGFEPLVSQEYRKPKVRGRSQKSKKDKARVEGTRVGAAIEFAKTQLSTPWVVGLLTFASLVGLDHYGWNWYYY